MHLCILWDSKIYLKPNSNKLHLNQGPFVQSILGLTFVCVCDTILIYEHGFFFMKYCE